MARVVVKVLSIALVTLGIARPGIACACPDFPRFDAVAKQAAIVLEGRVSGVVRTVDGWRSLARGRPSPVYVDVDVSRVLKGTHVSKRIRIWDDHYGSSCEGVLERLVEGTVATFALTVVSDDKAREGVRLGAPVPAGEYVLPFCREAWRRIEDQAAADEPIRHRACVQANPLAPPNKVRDNKPGVSDLRGIRTHAGVLIFDVIIGVSGSVTDVRLSKAIDAREPWPTLAERWRAAILEWRYEPTTVNNEPVAVCMTVSVIIDVM